MLTMLKILTIMIKMKNVDLVDHVFNFVDHSDLLEHGDHVDSDVIVTFTVTIDDIAYLEGLVLLTILTILIILPFWSFVALVDLNGYMSHVYHYYNGEHVEHIIELVDLVILFDQVNLKRLWQYWKR